MLSEDYTFNFLHGCWNYYLMKTDIDVMMLFKFDIKYVKLNFKAIASMEFSFDVNLYLLCSYEGCLFMENYWKLLQKNSRKFEWNSDQFVWFNWWSIASRSIECSFSIDRSSTNRARQIVKYDFFNFFDRSRYTFDRSKTVNSEFF